MSREFRAVFRVSPMGYLLGRKQHIILNAKDNELLDIIFHL